MAIDEGLNVMWQVAAEISANGRRSIAVLEDAGVVLQVGSTAVRVLGSTLWTDYGLRHKPITDAQMCEGAINDHRSIQGHDGPTIVVTHHLPSMWSVAGRFQRDATSSGFTSHADGLVGMDAALWVHGHTRDSMMWETGGRTLVVCNPAGYARLDDSRENAAFNPRLCVTLQESGGAWPAHPPA